MRFGIISAIVLSVIFVTTAFWMRFGRPETVVATLKVVETKQEKDAYYKELIDNFTTPASTNTTANTTKENLSDTDLIGRQLITDYVGLLSAGAATDANIKALAGKYVENIPKLITAEKLRYEDIILAPNNKSNFEKYGQQISLIYKEYASKLMTTQSGANLSQAISTDAAFIAAGKMGFIYQDAASKLEKISVPAELAEAHLALTNIYLENTTAIRSISLKNDDPAKAFAGLILLSDNLNREVLALKKIEEILNANGI